MSLKLITLNTDHGGRPIEKVIDFLQKENAEIVCLQEVYDGVDNQLEDNFRSLRIFKEKLSYPYYSFFPTHTVIIDNKKAPSGNLILSKFPIINSSFTFFNSYYQEFDFRGWFEKGDWENSIVDMVFVSKEIKIIDSYQPQVDISDHLPLVINFSFLK